MSVVWVTGATGKVGRHVVAGLLNRGAEVRALVRDPDRAGLPDGVDLVVGDLTDPASLRRLDRADALFLLWPRLSADGAAEAVGALASSAGRIVYLSAEAAARRPDSFWALVERAVERDARDWTFLRSTGFAANALMWADQIRTAGVVRWVYGAAARSLIDERDIAAVAVRALTESGHSGARYILTGPEVLTQVEQVEAIGEAIGRPLRWEEMPREEVARHLAGVPDTALDTWASFVKHPEVVTSTVQQLTGQRAHRFREWARYHAADFR
jgi:uncharacterized protein YbjT (DUF2867 family)